jgi:hypothetical protein
VLKPSLFFCFCITDRGEVVVSKILRFADDTQFLWGL